MNLHVLRLTTVVLGICSVFCITAAVPWQITTFPVRLHNGETGRKYLPATIARRYHYLRLDDDGLLDIFLPNGGELPSGLKTTRA
jgi:hypothetical protein